MVAICTAPGGFSSSTSEHIYTSLSLNWYMTHWNAAIWWWPPTNVWFHYGPDQGEVRGTTALTHIQLTRPICTSLDLIVNCDLTPAAQPVGLKARSSEGRSRDQNHLEYLLCLFTIHVKKKSHELTLGFQFWVEIWAGHNPNNRTVSACLSGDMGCNYR